MTNGFFSDIAKLISNTVKNWPGFEDVAIKLMNIPQTVHDRIYEIYQPSKDGFNVISHGDMFMNNILFRNDQQGRPIDIRLVSMDETYALKRLYLTSPSFRLIFQ